MKIKNILIPTVFLICSALQAQVSVEQLKGTWAIAALCDKDTNIAVMFRHDSVMRALISKNNPEAAFMYRYNSGKHHDYWFYNLQYISFDKREVGMGYAKDSTFTQREKGYQGKYKLRNNTLESPFWVIRDWQKVNVIEFPAELKISFEGEFLVLNTKGGQTIYYRRISNEVLFRD